MSDPYLSIILDENFVPRGGGGGDEKESGN